MLESQIERRLKNEIGKLGGKALKWESPNYRGVPDRIVLLPDGKLKFVELKAPGKTLRPLQQKRKRELEDLGFEVHTIDSYEAIDNFIKEIRGWCQ